MFGFGKRRKTIQQYEGQDVDRDSLNDAREIEVGLHDERNKPLHRMGPTTPGSATVLKGRGVVFDWDHSILNLKVHGSENVGGVHRMHEPRKMKLSVNIGGNHDKSRYSMDLNVRPEKYHLKSENIKPIKGLAARSEEFAKRQKKKTSLTPAKTLNFSHIGITTRLHKKKLKGVQI